MEDEKRKPSVATGMLVLWVIALGVWCVFNGYARQYLIGAGIWTGLMLLIELAVKLLKRDGGK